MKKGDRLRRLYAIRRTLRSAAKRERAADRGPLPPDLRGRVASNQRTLDATRQDQP